MIQVILKMPLTTSGLNAVAAEYPITDNNAPIIPLDKACPILRANEYTE